MPYIPFNNAKPDPTESIAQITTDVRTNFAAVRDWIVIACGLPGWSGEALGADGTTPPTDATQPEQWIWRRGTERIRAQLTYGDAGGSQGCVVSAVFSYSPDGGQTWQLMADDDYPNGTLTIDYDADSNVIGYHWS